MADYESRPTMTTTNVAFAARGLTGELQMQTERKSCQYNCCELSSNEGCHNRSGFGLYSSYPMIAIHKCKVAALKSEQPRKFPMFKI
jgi:hypothetical protein